MTIGLSDKNYSQYEMAIRQRFFVAIIILTLSQWIAGQETSSGGDDKVPATTGLDIDVNFTVGDICQHLADFYCIQSEGVYIHAGRCLTQYGNSTGKAAFGLCPYFPNMLSWYRFPYSDYYSLPPTRTLKEQSNLTCGPYNREGLLCSKCKRGYGPAVYSFSLM